MARADILNILYSKEKSPLEFQFDSLWIPSMYNYISIQDINRLYNIASSVRYSANIDLKYAEIDKIMRPLGFRKFHCGTNRIVYSYLEDTRFLCKIALDKVGLGDNPAEYRNQFLLKPFVTKTFEVSPCGTFATVERVQPITSREEYIHIANDIFDLLNDITGEYVLEDIGSKYFMNIGIRNSFGPCLLDYPYCYKLDGKKLYCNKVNPYTGQMCNGQIDYDRGFNNLVCNKCGKKYFAKDLEKSIDNNIIILKDEGEIDMKIKLRRGQEIVATFNSSDESETIVRREKRNNYNQPNKGGLKVSIKGLEQDLKIRDSVNLDLNTLKSTIEKQEVVKPQPKVRKTTPKKEVKKEEEKFEVKSNFIPEQKKEEIHLDSKTLEALGISEEDFKEDKDEKDDLKETIEDHPKENKYDIQKSCFGDYIVEEIGCLKCPDSSACSIETDMKNNKPESKKSRKNIMDQY